MLDDYSNWVSEINDSNVIRDGTEEWEIPDHKLPELYVKWPSVICDEFRLNIYCKFLRDH